SVQAARHGDSRAVSSATFHRCGDDITDRRRRTTPYWHIARDTKDSSWHSPGSGSRPCVHTLEGHLRDEVMSSELPVEKPFDWHSATLAMPQSGAPFPAMAQRWKPATTLLSGKRATVPAASVTPLVTPR